MTERLTEKFKDGRNILRKGIENIHHVGFGQFYAGEAIDKLSEYETAEEEGRLVVLPCDTVCERDIIAWQNEHADTAFDKEKVIEELENLKAQYFITIVNTGDERLGFAYKYVWNALNHAIEIVEKGGIG